MGELFAHFGAQHFTVQTTRTGVPVVWLARELLLDVMSFLRKVPSPFVMLFDLSATDERLRTHREGLPQSDFTVFY
ncbi:NADH-quinone oxidoreductase subunit C/D, partial [Aeromonas hydrophila]